LKKGKQFQIGSVSLEREAFHYKACGLDDVFLLNGFARRDSDYGKSIIIRDIDGLHRVIGMTLIAQRKTLAPKEIRFLRKEMDFTQEELARKLGLDVQTVARYEKGDTGLSGSADQLIRFFYILSIMPPKRRLKMIEEVQRHFEEMLTTDAISPQPMRFVETQRGWEQRPDA